MEGVQMSEKEPVAVYQVPGADRDAMAREEPVRAPKAASNSVEENPGQPILSDFGLYACVKCGKMVMGYE